MNITDLSSYMDQLTILTQQGSAASHPVAQVVQTMLRFAQMEGPLRLFGGLPTPSDLPTINQHLQQLSHFFNSLHDAKMLGDYLHAAVFLSQQAQLGLALAGATRLGGLNSPAQGGSCSAAHGGDPRSSLS